MAIPLPAFPRRHVQDIARFSTASAGQYLRPRGQKPSPTPRAACTAASSYDGFLLEPGVLGASTRFKICRGIHHRQTRGKTTTASSIAVDPIRHTQRAPPSSTDVTGPSITLSSVSMPSLGLCREGSARTRRQDRRLPCRRFRRHPRSAPLRQTTREDLARVPSGPNLLHYLRCSDPDQDSLSRPTRRQTWSANERHHRVHSTRISVLPELKI